MKILSLQGFFDDMLDSINDNSKMHTPYKFRVGCIKMAAPRDPRYAMLLDVGLVNIEAIFDNKPLVNSNLCFVFPERFLSIHEQQSFFCKLEKHPDFDKIESIDMITSSPLIIGGVRRDNILIITHDNDHMYNGQ